MIIIMKLMYDIRYNDIDDDALFCWKIMLTFLTNILSTKPQTARWDKNKTNKQDWKGFGPFILQPLFYKSVEKWFKKSGSRNLVREKWLEKNGWPEKKGGFIP